MKHCFYGKNLHEDSRCSTFPFLPIIFDGLFFYVFVSFRYASPFSSVGQGNKNAWKHGLLAWIQGSRNKSTPVTVRRLINANMFGAVPTMNGRPSMFFEEKDRNRAKAAKKNWYALISRATFLVVLGERDRDGLYGSNVRTGLIRGFPSIRGSSGFSRRLKLECLILAENAEP